MPYVTDVGVLGEHLAAAAFTAAGCRVSIPVGHDVPYDMIVDANGMLLRIQVKTTSRSEFDLRHNGHSQYYGTNDFDFYALVQLPTLDPTSSYEVYLLQNDGSNIRSWTPRAGHSINEQFGKLGVYW
jgi:hypothetical protein